jgi:hypothetical protein
MNISSSSLFRFLTEFPHLQKIITDGFGFRKCVEDMALQPYENDLFAVMGVVREQFHSWAVCFCDIPLAQSGSHRKQYGNYAIAMSKKWAMQHGITPVRYYHQQSPFQADTTARTMLYVLNEVRGNNNGLIGVLRKFLRERHNTAPTDQEMNQLPDSVKGLHQAINSCVQTWLEQFFGAFHTTRICEGKWIHRTTGEETERRFYDEREWRAITFTPDHRLTFELNDVRHIIVTSDEERRQLGELMIAQSEKLKITDPTKVWGVIKVGSELFDDI